MFRTYAAKRLLEHGPLRFSEFLEITGWKHRAATSALESLLETKVAMVKNINGHRHYVLA